MEELGAEERKEAEGVTSLILPEVRQKGKADPRI